MITQREDGTLETPNGATFSPADFDPIMSSSPRHGGYASSDFDMDLDGAFEELDRRAGDTPRDPKSPVKERRPLQDLFSSPNVMSPPRLPAAKRQPLRQESFVETFTQPFESKVWSPTHTAPTAAPQIAQIPSSPVGDAEPRKRVAATKAKEKIGCRREMSTVHDLDEPFEARADEEVDTMPKKRKRKEKAPQELVDDMKQFQDAVVSSSNPEETSNNDAGAAMPGVFLSEEQQRVLSMVVHERKNVFFTGAAGTGKSVLLRNIIQDLRAKHEQKNRAVTEVANTGRKVTRVAVCASTGLAACHIGGVTLHSFAGIGLGREPVDQLLKKIRKNKKSLNRWKQVRVLVLDEVSMVDGVLFDKLDEIGRQIRKCDKPFGGIQLVITGDFYQLPPVPDPNSVATFVFESKCWHAAVPNTVELRKVFRQKDSTFSSMLNELRRGHVSGETEQLFMQQTKDLNPAEGISATELFPRKVDVERANESRLRQLKTEAHTYDCEDWRDEVAGKYANFDNLMCVPKLTVKLGAQVMMIKNIDETLVNGTIGTVVGFMSESSFTMLQTDKLCRMSLGKVTRTLDEFNQRLLDKASEAEEELETIYGGKPKPDSSKQKISAALRRKHATLEKLKANAQNLGQVYPLVRYALPSGGFRIQLAQPEEWKLEDFDGKCIAKRTQVPLILAWALSIHKAQGQTLPYVKVDLGRAFEAGQAYVALSRAVSLEGLQVLGFRAGCVMVHSKVVEFYKSLSGVEQEQEDQEDGEDQHDQSGGAVGKETTKPFKKRKSDQAKRKSDTFDRNLFEFFQPPPAPPQIPPQARTNDDEDGKDEMAMAAALNSNDASYDTCNFIDN